MTFFKPPYGKIHIIALATFTFFLAIGLLFVFKDKIFTGNKEHDKALLAPQITGEQLKQEHPDGVQRLDSGNDVGALLIDNLVVIDVRPEENYHTAHLAGAHNIIAEELKNALLMETANIVLYADDLSLLQQATEAIQGKKVASVKTLSASLSDLESQGYTIVKQ